MLSRAAPLGRRSGAARSRSDGPPRAQLGRQPSASRRSRARALPGRPSGAVRAPPARTMIGRKRPSPRPCGGTGTGNATRRRPTRSAPNERSLDVLQAASPIAPPTWSLHPAPQRDVWKVALHKKTRRQKGEPPSRHCHQAEAKGSPRDLVCRTVARGSGLVTSGTAPRRARLHSSVWLGTRLLHLLMWTLASLEVSGRCLSFSGAFPTRSQDKKETTRVADTPFVLPVLPSGPHGTGCDSV